MPTADYGDLRSDAAADLFARAARALADDPRVVGSAIAVYRAAHELAEADLANWLGLPNVTALHQLALCTKPDAASPTFAADVAALADYAVCDSGNLHRLLVETASPFHHR